MKKAKLILSAVAVLAIVGGAFAFKANRSLKTYYITTASTLPVTVPLANATITNAAGGILYYYSTTYRTAPTTLTAFLTTTPA